MSGQHHKDVDYSPLEKKRSDYGPRTAHKGRTNWCIGGLCVAVVGLLVWVIYITLVINNVEFSSENNKLHFKTRDNLTDFQHKDHLKKGMTEKDEKDIKVLERIIADLTKKNAKSEQNGIDDDRLRRNLDGPLKNPMCQRCVKASQVTNFDGDTLSDLVFKTQANPWITMTKDSHKYFTLFAEDSRPLIEYEKSNGKKGMKRDRKKTKTEIDIERNKNIDGNPEFILSLKQDRNCLNIFAASGERISAVNDRLIAIGDDYDDWLVLDEDTKTPVRAGEMDYCWKLRKCDERFYVIESSKFSGRFWRTSQGNGVILDSIPELFTGINTNFIIGYELKPGENPQKAPAGIEEGKYGDILVKYIDPKGNEKDGWICDNGWTYKDADVFCRSKWPGHKGIPTYDGRFTENHHNIEYAISDMKCSSADTFVECKFKTECSDQNICRAQMSMRLHDGRGFGCNRGVKSDVAGVICGPKHQIEKIKNKKLEESCNENQLSADTRTAASMASIQKQANEVSQLMFEHKHWSEYLLPLPLTVSMISMVMLISSQYEGEVKIPRKNQLQKWEVLKFDILTPNLSELNNLVIGSFEYSTHAMQRININSVKMNEELEDTIKYSTLTDTKLGQRRMIRALTSIKGMAARSLKESIETIARFDAADKYIHELKTAMDLTQAVSRGEKKRLEILKNVTETKRRDLEEKREKEIKQYEILKDVEKKSRTALFETALKAKSASCLMDEQCSSRGSRPCNSCQFREAYIRKEDNIPICLEPIEKCVEEKRTCKIYSNKCTEKEMKCVEYDYICLNSTTVCESYGEAKCKKLQPRCKVKKSYSPEKGSLCINECSDQCGKTWGNPCCNTKEDGWEECEKDGKCIEYEDKCTEFFEAPCVKWIDACQGEKTQVCIKEQETCQGNTDYCIEYETICTRKETGCRKYEMVSEGTFCMDQNSQQYGACCSGCAGREAFEETFKAVLDTSLRLASQIFQGDSHIDIVDRILTTDLDILQSLKRSLDSTSTVETREKRDVNDETTTKIEIQSSSTESAENATDQDNDDDDDETTTKRGGDFKTEIPSSFTESTLNENERDTNDDTKTKKEDKPISIEVDIERLKLGIPLQISQLDIIAMSNHLAAESKMILGEIKDAIENIPENEIKDVKFLNENAKRKITKFKSQLEGISKKVSKAAEEELVDINGASFKSSVDIAEKAETYLESKIAAMKTARKTEMISSSLESALESIASQKIEVNDYKKTIKFLIRCSTHLTSLKQAWGELKDFFGTLETFLLSVQQSAETVNKEFTEIMELLGVKRSASLTAKLRKETTRSTAYNIYIKKLSSFYVGIMRNGLLRKIRGLNFYRLTPEKAESYKTYILNECKAQIQRISNEVSKEQADLNDEMTETIASINNKLTCALKETNLPDKLKEYEAFEDSIKQMEQMKQVISNEDGNGPDDKTIQETEILKPSPVKSPVADGTASERFDSLTNWNTNDN